MYSFYKYTHTQHIWYTDKICGLSAFLFFKEIITFIQQGWVKLIKSHSKDIYNTTKDFYFKLMLFLNVLSIKELW